MQEWQGVFYILAMATQTPVQMKYDEELLLYHMSPNGKFMEKLISFQVVDKTKKETLLDSAWGEEQEEKKIEYTLWFQERLWELSKAFEDEVDELEEGNIYYFGCSFKVYEYNYEARKQDFLKEFEDASDIDFIEEELERGVFELPYDKKYIQKNLEKKLRFGLKRRYQFLEEKAGELGCKIEYYTTRKDEEGKRKESFQVLPIHTEKPSILSVKWNRGNNAEVAELVKALIETSSLDPALTQAEIFRRFSLFFDFDINETTGIRDFSKRRNNGGDLTRYLDFLKEGLEKWFSIKEEKKEYR